MATHFYMTSFRLLTTMSIMQHIATVIWTIKVTAKTIGVRRVERNSQTHLSCAFCCDLLLLNHSSYTVHHCSACNTLFCLHLWCPSTPPPHPTPGYSGPLITGNDFISLRKKYVCLHHWHDHRYANWTSCLSMCRCDTPHHQSPEDTGYWGHGWSIRRVSQ